MFNKRIQIEKVSTIDDEAGGTEKSWDHYLSTWANINEYSIKSTMIDEQMTNTVNAKFIVRNRNGIKGEQLRVIHDGITLVVSSIQEDENGDLILECEGQ